MFITRTVPDTNVVGEVVMFRVYAFMFEGFGDRVSPNRNPATKCAPLKNCSAHRGHPVPIHSVLHFHQVFADENDHVGHLIAKDYHSLIGDNRPLRGSTGSSSHRAGV